MDNIFIATLKETLSLTIFLPELVIFFQYRMLKLPLMAAGNSLRTPNIINHLIVTNTLRGRHDYLTPSYKGGN